jgi:hypothetical protein
MMDWVQVGKEVVCVDDSNGSPEEPRNGQAYTAGLRNGSTYVITAVHAPNCFWDEILLIQVGGIIGAWFHTRFRPVIKKTTDISSLEKLLHTVKTPEKIDA